MYFDPNASPIQATVGVYVVNVGDLNLSTGIFWMDFYLTIYCDRPCTPEPDIINAVELDDFES